MQKQKLLFGKLFFSPKKFEKLSGFSLNAWTFLKKKHKISEKFYFLFEKFSISLSCWSSIILFQKLIEEQIKSSYSRACTSIGFQDKYRVRSSNNKWRDKFFLPKYLKKKHLHRLGLLNLSPELQTLLDIILKKIRHSPQKARHHLLYRDRF